MKATEAKRLKELEQENSRLKRLLADALATYLARGGAPAAPAAQAEALAASHGTRELLRAKYPHHVWAIDFQFDQTMDGRRLKFLNIVDEYSRRENPFEESFNGRFRDEFLNIELFS